MKKGLIRKGLVFSVIALFISAGVQPVFAGESITSTLDSDEDCIECQEIDRISLFKAKILLFKIKVVTNFILTSRLGDIPDIKENCQEILDVTNPDKPLDSPFICDILESVVSSIVSILGNIQNLSAKISNGVILSLLELLFFNIGLIWTGFYVTGVALDCWDFPSTIP